MPVTVSDSDVDVAMTIEVGVEADSTGQDGVHMVHGACLEGKHHSQTSLSDNDRNIEENACGAENQTNEDPDENEPLKPPEGDGDSQPSYVDHGWAWMIVVGCCMMHMLVGGFSRSYGIIYIYLMERFGGSAAVTAWVGGATSALRMGGSPISTALVHRFSTRPVVFCGGLLVGIGVVLSAYTPNTEFLFFSYSLMTGCGGALVYSPGVVITGQYFNKYRSIAIGLATAGSGIGVFSFPPFMNYLFETYSYSGAMVIMGALLLNNCVAAMLYRPPDTQKTEEKNIKQCTTDQESPKKVTLDTTSKSTIGTKERIVLKLDEGLSNSSKNLAATYSPALKRSVKSASPSSLDKSEVEPTPDGSKSKCCDMETFYKYLDVRLFKNKTFVCYTLSLSLITLSYISGQMLIPPFAQEQNVTKAESMWLLSIIGVADTVGRVVSGFIFNIPSVRGHRRHYYTVAMVFSGITHVLWAVSRGFTMFAVVCAMHGLVSGVIVSQRAVICIDLMGLEILPSSFGLSVLFQGVGVLIGPAVAGLFYDLTGTYFYSYFFTGFCAFLSAVFLFSEWFFIARKSAKKQAVTMEISGETKPV